MSKLESVYPKDSFVLSTLYAIAFCSIIFSLPWYYILLTSVIDSIVFLLIKNGELQLFYKLYPKFQILRDYDKAIDSKRTLEEQNSFFNILASFPEKRSFHVFLTSVLKVLPVGIFISAVSEVTPSFWENLLLFYVLDIFILIFHHCFLYIALHQVASGLMADLKEHEMWKMNYRDLRLVEVKDRFSQVQNFVILSLLVNLLGMVFYTIGYKSILQNHFIFAVFVIAILCICKIQLATQRYFRESLESVFKIFSHNVSQSKLQTVSVHTTPMLANFEYTFNQLSMKLEERENEISQWLKHESEQFHLRSLGEVTAMVAHDMKTPLNVMSMSLDVINDQSASAEKKEKYKQILEKNLELSISFSQTLMAYVRGNKGEMTCLFGDIHRHLLEIFKTQFFESDLEKIKFNLSDELAQINLQVSRLDAMHVFYNLYQNAIRSILSHVPHQMSISIYSEVDLEENSVAIFVKDTGPGLKAETFHRLISFERYSSDSHFYHGLGLRLTNTILNHIGGKFEIESVESGTCLKVTLPLADEKIFVSGQNDALSSEQLH